MDGRNRGGMNAPGNKLPLKMLNERRHLTLEAGILHRRQATPAAVGVSKVEV